MTAFGIRLWNKYGKMWCTTGRQGGYPMEFHSVPPTAVALISADVEVTEKSPDGKRKEKRGRQAKGKEKHTAVTPNVISNAPIAFSVPLSAATADTTGTYLFYSNT